MKKKPDLAHQLTDQELAALEKRIAAEYKKAADELTEKINVYFDSMAKRDAEIKKMIGQTVNGKEYTERDYQQWRLAQIGRGKRFEALRDRVAERMTEANEVASEYMNDATPGIYSLNRNYAAYRIESQVGSDVGFDLWDEQTVKRLLVEEPDLMPYYPPTRAVKRGIDLAWGKQQITRQITSGILQGESIKHLAERLQTNIPDMNRDSAIRAARTAVTGAQNAGRQDSYDAAAKMGIEMEKKWMATLDMRTRHDHAMADGQVVANDEPFEVGGEKLMFPGDKSGSAWNIYNCRCTTFGKVKGVDMSDAKRRARDPVTGESEVISGMTYKEWYAMKEQQHGREALLTARKKVERESSDRKQFEEYHSILGKNAPKSFADFQNLKYNSGEWEAFKSYKKAIQTGELSALADFSLYQKTSREIDEKLVGLTTSNGILITGNSKHFIARVIGSVEQRRSGVDIQDVASALTSSEAKIFPIKTYSTGDMSQKFRHSGVEVTVNPKTGNLVQTNPKKEG